MSKSELTVAREKREWKDIATYIKQGTADVLLFAKRLLGTLIGLVILGLGVYAAIKGWTTPETLKHYAFVVSGGCAVADGLWIMYCALVKIK